MPLRTADDHPRGDTTKTHCKHCARTDGSLKSYDEVLEGMTQFIVRTQGIDAGAAERAAKDMMKAQPAWQKR
jgi:hypothetical protein